MGFLLSISNMSLQNEIIFIDNMALVGLCAIWRNGSTSLYKGVDGVIRRCVPEHEQEQILRKCYSEAYEGHHAGDRTAHKVLQSDFYWPTLFKDARKFVVL